VDGCGFLIFDGGVIMDYFFFFKIFVASFIMTFIFVFSMGGCERFSWVYRVYDTLSTIFSGIAVFSLIITLVLWVFD
jgi:hypothetical protein